MGRQVVLTGLFVAMGAALAGSAAQTPMPSGSSVTITVHEWGTFTSIAGADGQAVQWLPQAGPGDLPCFVERSPWTFKGAMMGTVRMETPVLYFYSPHAVDVSVDVAFKQGLITEWYPHAAVGQQGNSLMTTNGTISWPSVQVRHDARDVFPQEKGTSHYYTARDTAADSVRIGSQVEKFLFYRGLGQFQPPMTAVAQPDGGAVVSSRRGVPLGDVIFFENRRGAMAFTVHHLGGNTARLPRPDMDDASGAPLAELVRVLVANGLYEAEAKAMVNTWKDSWFEEGARLLYIVPRVDVDAILPLKIAPQPSAIARVFVGRMEIVTPATIRDVSTAIASGDRAVLAKYGRFLQPIAQRAGLGASVPAAVDTSPFASACR
jgi:hypothetical protein